MPDELRYFGVLCSLRVGCCAEGFGFGLRSFDKASKLRGRTLKFARLLARGIVSGLRVLSLKLAIYD